MQGVLTMRRLGVCVLAAAALAVTGASPANAAIWGPGCSATLTPIATSASCGFDSPTDWSNVRVTPVGGTVTATIRCTNFGTTTTKSRTFSANGTWSTSTAGTCSLILTPVTSGAAANGSAHPGIPPIIDPGPAV